MLGPLALETGILRSISTVPYTTRILSCLRMKLTAFSVLRSERISVFNDPTKLLVALVSPSLKSTEIAN